MYRRNDGLSLIRVFFKKYRQKAGKNEDWEYVEVERCNGLIKYRKEGAGVGLVAVEVSKELLSLLYVVVGKWSMHQTVELAYLLIGVVGEGAEASQFGAGYHITVDEAVSSREERLEQLEFQSGGLIGEKNVHLCVGDEMLHCFVIGVGYESGIGERVNGVNDVAGWVATRNDEGGGGFWYDVFGKIANGVDIFLDREVGVVECIPHFVGVAWD